MKPEHQGAYITTDFSSLLTFILTYSADLIISTKIIDNNRSIQEMDFQQTIADILDRINRLRAFLVLERNELVMDAPLPPRNPLPVEEPVQGPVEENGTEDEPPAETAPKFLRARIRAAARAHRRSARLNRKLFLEATSNMGQQ